MKKISNTDEGVEVMGHKKPNWGCIALLVGCLAVAGSAHADFTMDADVMPAPKKTIATKVEVKEIDVSKPQAVAAPVVKVPEPVPVAAAPAVPPPPPKPVCVWEVQPKQSYEASLKSWVKCAGWNDVSWQGKEMVPTFYASFAKAGSLEQALREFKRASGLDITVYEDNKLVVVVVPR
jgi:hypothetical protein